MTKALKKQLEKLKKHEDQKPKDIMRLANQIYNLIKGELETRKINRDPERLTMMAI